MKAIFVISGEKKTGKTRFLQNLISVLAETGYKLSGFTAQHNETTDSYHIKNIQTHEKILLMSRTGPTAGNSVHFEINKAGVLAGIDWMNSAENENADILVMDEIGYYELSGMIWHEIFSKAINSPKPLIFTTKTRHLPEIISKWRFHPTAIFYRSEFLYPEKAAEQISETINLFAGKHKNKI